MNFIGTKNRFKSHGLLIPGRNLGFTIVELLVVIVIIGILAAITVVSYTGITKKANEALMVSSLANAKKQFSLYYTDHGVYPTGLNANNCPTNADVTPNPDIDYCIKPGPNNIFTITSATGSSYTLAVSMGTVTYVVTDSTSPTAYALVCPSGFIVVPGSATYGTSDFCVMKYEAKRVGATTTPISTADGLPWIAISEINAAAYSANVSGCSGCHLITESEWMTIAQNVLSVSTNWSSGVVGSGYIYSGHNDNNPASALAAGTDDNSGYFGTGQTTGNQRRTLTLSNGEVIWDLAGNVCEWTSNTQSGGQPSVTGDNYNWHEWTAINNLGTLLPNPSPLATGLTNAGTWTSASNGIGMIYSSNTDNTLRGTLRGGARVNGSQAGVLNLDYERTPDAGFAYSGFRVSR